MQRCIHHRILAHSRLSFRISGRRIRGFAKEPASSARAFSQVAANDTNVDFGSYSIVLPPEEPETVLVDSVPSNIPRPSYILGNKIKNASSRLIIGSDNERRLRGACRLAKETLDYAGSLVAEGTTTAEIDQHVHEFIISSGAYPSPLNYDGFPKSICTSVNNIVSHGIPDSRPLEDGDTINIDITVFLDGFHGDTSRTFEVGKVDEKGKNLLSTAYTALQVGIGACGPGQYYRDIGNSIHAYIHGRPIPLPRSPSNKPVIGHSPSRAPIHRPSCDGVVYSICSAFSGHGIGTEFHMKPWIFNDRNEEPGRMQPGDCFTIEPIILQTIPGTPTPIWIWADGWTASTENGARGAVFEHTVMITENGVDVLTA